MRKEFGKVLTDYFSAEIKTLAPDFKEEKARSRYMGPGERAFRKRIDDASFCWISLSPSPKDYDEFTLLLGWSVFGRYPELSMIPSLTPPSPEHLEFSEPEYLTRLPQLWTNEDHWWTVKPFQAALTLEQLQASLLPITRQEAEALVVPQVDLACSKLLEIGIPYLNSYMAFKRSHDR